MAEITQRFRADAPGAPVEAIRPRRAGRRVYVLFTSPEETLHAARVAGRFARALRTHVTVVHFRPLDFASPLERPAGASPAESEEFTRQLEAVDGEARVEVCLCRNARQVIRTALAGALVVVIGGGRSPWWPSRADRWRRTLESAGFLVVVARESGRG